MSSSGIEPGTVVVGKDLNAVQRFFGLSPWPDGLARFDLGGRAVEVFGIPGHHATSIAVYDPRSRFLVTGDTVYPGRLYVQDISAFVASLNRLVAFAESRRVDRVMGCHIEMTRTRAWTIRSERDSSPESPHSRCRWSN